MTLLVKCPPQNREKSLENIARKMAISLVISSGILREDHTQYRVENEGKTYALFQRGSGEMRSQTILDLSALVLLRPM